MDRRFTGIVHSVHPATSPARKAKAVATSRPASGMTQWAIERIRCRFRLGHSIETPPALSGITTDKPLAEGERVMRFTEFVGTLENNLVKQPVGLSEPAWVIKAAVHLSSHLRYRAALRAAPKCRAKVIAALRTDTALGRRVDSNRPCAESVVDREKHS